LPAQNGKRTRETTKTRTAQTKETQASPQKKQHRPKILESLASSCGIVTKLMTTRSYRLPTHIRPLSYHIDLSCDPSRAEFSGTVSIELELMAPTDTIVLHARDLEVTRACASPLFGETDSALITYQAEQETVSLLLGKTLPVGRAKAELSFSGRLSHGMRGLYLATDGTHSAVCSQCEATEARAIFPCFDEPAFKATLRFTIRTGSGVVALTSGVLANHRLEPSQQVYEFAETKPVSSYLAAIVVGDLDSEPARHLRDIPMRVYAPSGKASQTQFAQGITERLLPWFEQYFDFPYPFGKYDQVAVPGFDAGAMENIGLVLFRQNLLLMSAGSASWRQEKTIALIIAHEMAHMWFGNVVTMKWWDDLWLNEAFAEWMAHKVVHTLCPEYEVWNDFIEDKARVLFDDALYSTHPIFTPVETPDQAIEMFDSITYQKGCAVMRMLEHFLGESHFRDALRTYMKEFQYGNAQGKDLWRALEQQSGQPVERLMESWVSQPGFPVVDVELVASPQDPSQGPALHLSQQRFFSDKSSKKSDSVWCIPMTVRYADDEGEKTHRFVFDVPEKTVPLPASGHVRFVYANQDEIGFFRQRFSENTLAQLLPVATTVLSPVELVGLVEDSWAMVRNATRSIHDFLGVLWAASESKHHSVLRVVAERLDVLDLLVKDSGDKEARTKLRVLSQKRFSPHLEELGFAPRPNETQHDMQRRVICISTLASLSRVPQVISEAEILAQAELADPCAVDANLAGTLVAVAAKFGDEARFDRWIDTFQKRKAAGRPPQEVARYLHTLSHFRRPGLPERTLELMAQGVIPQESISSVFTQLLSFRHSQLVAWEFLKQHWDTLCERFGELGISRVIEALGRLPGQNREDLLHFFETHRPAGAERALRRALERMDQTEELRKRITPDLCATLRKS